MTNKQISLIVGFVVLLIVFFFTKPFVLINAGNRGVVLNWGAVSDTIMNEGFNWKTPIKQKIVELDVQTQKLETDTLAYSKDIQTVETKLALNYHLKPEMVNKLWQEVGKDYQSRIIDPAIQESVKSATAKFTAQELIEQRPKVKDEIKAELFTRLATYIVIDEFSIIDFSFSDEYEKAVEQKQVAQQNALKAENDLVRIKTEAEQRVAEAEAEARAIQIQAEAITQQGGKEYVNLKWVETWDGKLPSYVMGTDVNALLNLPSGN
ncbi:prohibitin family protein [Candidatus Dojkabacteria bacterium]|jgi:regulator of protease activity HflC (stomatin/prohibitin superfamily)|nr:prohibitin family protein [Candidatus Dojkabacteria bacterium]